MISRANIRIYFKTNPMVSFGNSAICKAKKEAINDSGCYVKFKYVS